MNKHTEAISNDPGKLAQNARVLMAATADLAGDKAAEASRRLAAELENGKELYGRVRDKASDGLKAGDDAVRENPYRAISIAPSVGVLLGYLAARQCSRNQ